MTNQPDEIEEEQTVPVKVQTNRELVAQRRAYAEYVQACDELGVPYETFKRWVSYGS